MILNSLYNDTAQKALIICPEYIDKDVFYKFISNFENIYSFYIINLEESDYPNNSSFQAVEIEKILSEKSVFEFKFIFSISLGGLSALQLYSREKIHFDLCIIDSTPMLDLGILKEKFVINSILKERKNINVKDYEKLLYEAFGSNSDTFLNSIYKLDDASLKVVIHDVMRFNFPKINTEKQKNLHIRYGENDFAKQSVKHILEHYPKSNIYIKKQLTHCEEFLQYNDNFINFMKKIV